MSIYVAAASVAAVAAIRDTAERTRRLARRPERRGAFGPPSSRQRYPPSRFTTAQKRIEIFVVHDSLSFYVLICLLDVSRRFPQATPAHRPKELPSAKHAGSPPDSPQELPVSLGRCELAPWQGIDQVMCLATCQVSCQWSLAGRGSPGAVGSSSPASASTLRRIAVDIHIPAASNRSTWLTTRSIKPLDFASRRIRNVPQTLSPAACAIRRACLSSSRTVHSVCSSAKASTASSPAPRSTFSH